MLLMAKLTVLPSIYKEQEVLNLRNSFGQHIGKMKESGKLISGWDWLRKRRFFIVDVNSGEELLDLLSPIVLDHANVDVQPVVELEKLGEFFKNTLSEINSLLKHNAT